MDRHVDWRAHRISKPDLELNILEVYISDRQIGWNPKIHLSRLAALFRPNVQDFGAMVV